MTGVTGVSAGVTREATMRHKTAENVGSFFGDVIALAVVLSAGSAVAAELAVPWWKGLLCGWALLIVASRLGRRREAT